MDLSRRRGSDSRKAARDEGRPCWYARSGSNRCIADYSWDAGPALPNICWTGIRRIWQVCGFGETTDTQDATGTVLQRSSVESVTEDRIREVAAGFEGRIQQVPPMYSAVKVDGVRLYKSARAGHDVERQAREVTVFHLDIVGIQIPDVTFRVACSKGTYIRTLCADIGHRLGVGGHMSTLVRERVGPLKVEQALTVDEVESRLEQGTLSASMLTLDEALAGLPACTVGAGTARRVIARNAGFPF